MPLYEHTVIARPDLTSAQAQTLSDTVGQLVVDQGAKVVKTEYWGLRNLAYRLRKNRKCHYSHVGIEGPSSVIMEGERTERINEDVLRYLTVRVEKVDEGPSIVMVAKTSRDERGRRDRGEGRGFDRDRGEGRSFDRDRDRDRDRGGDRGGDRGEGRGERSDSAGTGAAR